MRNVYSRNISRKQFLRVIEKIRPGKFMKYFVGYLKSRYYWTQGFFRVYITIFKYGIKRMKKNQVCWNKSSKKLVGESNSQKQVSNVQSVKNADNAEEKLYYAGKKSQIYIAVDTEDMQFMWQQQKQLVL